MWTRWRTRESHHPCHHDPVFILLCDEEECMHASVRACVCVCTFACLTFLCRRTCMWACSCVFESENKDSIWSEPLNVPVGNTLSFWTPFLKQLGGGVVPGGEQRGVPFEAATRAGSPQLKPFSPLQCSCTTLTRGDTLSPLLPSPPQLSNSIRCNYMCNKESGDPGRLCW